MPQGSGTLSKSQIRAVASAAGFSGSDLDIAVAVAMAESGGNPKAHNPNPPDNSYGLWQINMIGGLGPSRRKAFGLRSNTDLFIPSVNAKAAYRIFKDAGGKWNPWTTYTSGSYKKFMGESGEDVSGKPALESIDPDTETNPNAGMFAGIQQSVHQFTETIRMSAILFVIIWVAIILLVLGIIILNRERAAKITSLVGPGKVTKLVKAVA